MDFQSSSPVSAIQTQTAHLSLDRTNSVATVPHRRGPSPVSPISYLTEPIEVVGDVHPPPDRGDVLIPTKPNHWESVKDVIEELYIHKNVRLKDVIEIMQVLYKFRATARMYKAQFAKWNWHKYSTGSAARARDRSKSISPTSPNSSSASTSHAGLPGGKKKGTARVFVVNGGQAMGIHRKLLEADESRHLATTMSACRRFILGWSEQDSRWKGVSCFTKMGHYDPSMISHFFAAMKEFQSKNFVQGGRLLRGAFLGLEDLVADGHVAAIWDCCVTIPQLTLNHGRRDILLTFLRYLSRLTAARVPGHPIATISRSTLAFVEHLGNFNHVSAYTTLAWNLWSETIIQLLGYDNISTLHINRAYLIIQPTPDPVLTRRLITDYDRLVDKAMTSLGEDNTTALSLEYDALLTQLRFAMPDSQFQSRVERVLYKLTHKPDNANLKPVQWSADDRQIYRGSWYLSTVYAEDVAGDMDRARECRRAFFLSPPDGDWVQFALKMEERLRARGLAEEADEVRDKRQEVQLPSKIVEILDREEREASVDSQGRAGSVGSGGGRAGATLSPGGPGSGMHLDEEEEED
ncbi:hypothetical protein QBC37DRAFT_315742 [Rhypophila decipiens]|uniref:Clr5 domain-containing protein n=1 Tax=Rhypophila decipiens TaxID=261697 RepID=A0AAN7BAA5_9PEZI|nr:hypothetical protein QBC37DRAFT_315742 [Rhypophila decipiens]